MVGGGGDQSDVTHAPRHPVLPSLSLVAPVAAVVLTEAVEGLGAPDGSQESSHIDQIEDNTQEDDRSEEGEGGGGAGGVEVQETALVFHQFSLVFVEWLLSHGGSEEERQYVQFGHDPREGEE